MMDWDKAIEHTMPRAVPPRNAREVLHAKLQEYHAGHPQRAKLAELALGAVHGGLDELAKLGHRFHLVASAAEEHNEYPKMMYHDSFPSRIIEREEDLPKEPGWRATPMVLAGEPKPEEVPKEPEAKSDDSSSAATRRPKNA